MIHDVVKRTLRWVGIVLSLLCQIVRKNKFNFKDMQIRSAMDDILKTIEFSCQQISSTTEQTPSADDDYVIWLKAQELQEMHFNSIVST